MAVTRLRTYQHLACVCFVVVDKAALLLSVAEYVGTWYLALLSHCACDRSHICFVDTACHFLHRSCLCSKAVIPACLPACLFTITEGNSTRGGADHIAEHLWMHNLWIPQACLTSHVQCGDVCILNSSLFGHTGREAGKVKLYSHHPVTWQVTT